LWEGEVVRKRERRINVVRIMCPVYVSVKGMSVETIPGIRGGRMLESSGGVNSVMIH
jgi:hypothetical protein